MARLPDEVPGAVIRNPCNSPATLCNDIDPIPGLALRRPPGAPGACRRPPRSNQQRQSAPPGIRAGVTAFAASRSFRVGRAHEICTGRLPAHHLREAGSGWEDAQHRLPLLVPKARGFRVASPLPSPRPCSTPTAPRPGASRRLTAIPSPHPPRPRRRGRHAPISFRPAGRGRRRRDQAARA